MKNDCVVTILIAIFFILYKIFFDVSVPQYNSSVTVFPPKFVPHTPVTLRSLLIYNDHFSTFPWKFEDLQSDIVKNWKVDGRYVIMIDFDTCQMWQACYDVIMQIEFVSFENRESDVSDIWWCFWYDEKALVLTERFIMPEISSIFHKKILWKFRGRSVRIKKILGKFSRDGAHHAHVSER